KRREFDEIYDLVGLRVLVSSEKDCYAALGTIHSTWKPLQGRFKDYIAMPKFNLYQSLHTTVVGPQGKNIEVQIRTHEMHKRAEFGVAAHWNYKESGPLADVGWLHRIVDWQAETDDPVEFMESLKLDLDQDEVFVFTPKGDVITMPLGATALDFAYAIHTDVGHRCMGARVNGQLATIDSVLKSGDRVEIVINKTEQAKPSRDWLQVVVTPRAKNKIRQWFSRSRREEAIESGRDELVKFMRRQGLPVQKLANSDVLTKVAVDLHYADLEALHQAIGENHVSAQSVAQRVARDLRGGESEEQLPTTVSRPARSRVQGTGGVHVEGLDDVMVRLALCCTPVPGDGIVGFVTTGRGVSVHRADCANAVTLTTSMGERQIEVEWDGARAGVFVASIEVQALDRARLLGDVSTALADHHVNIVASSTHTGSDRVARLRFDFELADPSHLDSLLKSVKRVEAVFDAYRLLPGSRR
ncbi:MAG: bifunctional (p)ppGpp synthetase/guanosine-3',5'-bis(diphosphate) 3'-pyrophosphohydrolase, partial [Acidimicrobiia bacterium]|nr:bifunctional (p)ppGpp synthetase/guanosine-3',5'-bis(diphosphate) 3'-pyrophosphohydrolase [Acidimicrobiia bacterium]